jgi:predicted KAP-like P-loop ATPase
LVVIDDLDRITKAETRSVIQHIKVNADFPHLIYLILYHEELVANHLEEPPVSGKQFLEKVVQLPFNIPAIPQARV